MSTVSSPSLSPEFLASLSGLPQARISQESLWSRLRRWRSARIGAGILGASITVVVVAYGVGGIHDKVGDSVTPASDRYAADFFGPTTIRATSTLTPAAMTELNNSGWPCHGTLAGDLHRTGAQWVDDGQTISVTYANTTDKLKLFEQNGSLDADGLQGFDRRTIANADVWIREGMPAIVTWDHDGVVYTLVTDAGRQHIAAALRQLPTSAPDGGPVERIGDGFDKMASWIMPAA